MTAAALRRRADQKLVDADSLASDADQLRGQAAALHGLLDPLVSISQRVWVGPAASDFEERARERGQQVDDQAATLRRIAAEFDDEARRLRIQAAALRRQADAEDAAEAAAPTGVAQPVVPTGVL